MTHDEKKHYIEDKFPQLQFVKHREWIQTVCEIWVKVWEKSSWENLEEVPANPTTPTSSLLNHVRSVTENCIQVAKVRESIHGDRVNMDILIVAATLHDVGKVMEYERGPDGKARFRLGELYTHGFYGAHTVLTAGLPDEIVNIILTHAALFRPYPKTIEGMLLYYCDMVDADLNRLKDGVPLLVASHK